MKRVFALAILTFSCATPKPRQAMTSAVSSKSVGMKPQVVKLETEEVAQRRRRALPYFERAARGTRGLSYQRVESLLGEQGLSRHDTVPVLLMGLSHEDPKVRDRAQEALGELTQTGIDYLILSLKEPGLAEAAAMALGNLGSRAVGALAPLAHLFEHGTASSKMASLIAMGEIDVLNEITQKTIGVALGDQDPGIALFATVLAKKSARAKKTLKRIVRRGASSEKAAALWLMISLGFRESVDAVMPNIIKSLFSKDALLRYMSAKAVGRSRSRNPILKKVLKRARRDSWDLVRKEASRSMAVLN